jgi:WD40 repeat protein
VRSLALVLVVCGVLAMPGCGGNTEDAETSYVRSLRVSCDPTTIQSGSTSQCTGTWDCKGKACYNAPAWTANFGTIDTWKGVFTAPETDMTLYVHVTAAVGDQSATTTVTVNP